MPSDTPSSIAPSGIYPSWIDSASYLSLATDRRDGREVRTPVWFARTGDAIYLFSAPEVGKVKRLRRTRAGRIAPCDMRGNTSGDFVPVSGELLHAANDIAEALASLRRKYGLLMWFTDFAARLAGRFERRQYIRLRVAQRTTAGAE